MHIENNELIKNKNVNYLGFVFLALVGILIKNIEVHGIFFMIEMLVLFVLIVITFMPIFQKEIVLRKSDGNLSFFKNGKITKSVSLNEILEIIEIDEHAASYKIRLREGNVDFQPELYFSSKEDKALVWEYFQSLSEGIEVRKGTAF